MKKGIKVGIVVALAVVGAIAYKNSSTKKVDAIAGASYVPLENSKYLSDSKVIARYFITINGENKFIGYYAKYDVDENNYYKIRVNSPGPDKKWFTKDDMVMRYYHITKEGDKEVSNFRYNENIKEGTPYFSGDDRVSDGSKVVEFTATNKPLKEKLYKGDKIVGEAYYTYDKNGKLTSRIEKDLDGKLKGESIYTYEVVDGESVMRRTDYYANGDIRRWRDMYYKSNGKKDRLVKYDDQGRRTAVERYDSFRRAYN